MLPSKNILFVGSWVYNFYGIIPGLVPSQKSIEIVKSGFLTFRGLRNSFCHAVTEKIGPKNGVARFYQKLVWEGYNLLGLTQK